jgi:hypothetical protein
LTDCRAVLLASEGRAQLLPQAHRMGELTIDRPIDWNWRQSVLYDEWNALSFTAPCAAAKTPCAPTTECMLASAVGVHVSYE